MSIRAYIVSCLALLSLAFVQSCDDGMEAINDSDTVMVNIALKLTQDNGNTPNDTLNENVIKRVDLFLYKQGGAAGGKQPVFTKIGFQPTYNTTTHSATISVPIPLSAYYQLFPNSSVTKCDAYIIANRPTASTLPNDDYDMPSIKGNTVLHSQTFGERVLTQIKIDGEPVRNEYNTTKQSDFVMEGFAQIDRSNQTLTGSIPMERVAVKIGLTVDINTVDTLNTKWIPDLENVMVTMRGGINRTNVGTTHDKYLYSPNKQSDIFDLRAIAMNTGDGDNRTTKYPIYTYPTNWGTDEDCRTYFILTVNWTKETVTIDGESQGDGEQEDGEQTNNNSKTTYYEIPVNPAGTFLKRNTYYKINQTVEVLGSEDEENPVVLYPCNYTILDWGNAMADGKDTDVEAEISKLKFLVLDETNVELNNTQSRQLYFFSSNPVEILNVKVEKNNVSGNVSNIQELANVVEPQLVDDKYTITSNSLKKPVTLKVVTANANNADSRNYIYFEHLLDNNMNSESDYSEYIVTFDVQHTGDSRYIETVRITQYPMISIKADLNSDYGGDGDNSNNTRNGYVFVNNNNTSANSNNSTTGWYGVYQSGLASDGANANPNRYIISVSSITEELGDHYIIGDPRSKDSSVPQGLNKDGNNKSLEYYYPTLSDTYTNTMISPEFMTASSYGRCPNSMKFDEAEKRCAAYQEDGYPAGRWRLPTIAEIKYIVQLSGWKIIPSLFSTGIGYWSAHGCIQVSEQGVVSDGSNAGTKVVRCVYDTWYWGTEHDAGSIKFVYGDKQR